MPDSWLSLKPTHSSGGVDELGAGSLVPFRAPVPSETHEAGVGRWYLAWTLDCSPSPPNEDSGKVLQPTAACPVVVR